MDSLKNDLYGEVFSFHLFEADLGLPRGTAYGGGEIFLDSLGYYYIAAYEQISAKMWGCKGTEIPGARNIDFSGGIMNTKAILESCPDTNIMAYACANFEVLGINDWYMPCITEMERLVQYYFNTGKYNPEQTRYWMSSNEKDKDYTEVYYVGYNKNTNVYDPRRFSASKDYDYLFTHCVPVRKIVKTGRSRFEVQAQLNTANGVELIEINYPDTTQPIVRLSYTGILPVRISNQCQVPSSVWTVIFQVSATSIMMAIQIF